MPFGFIISKIENNDLEVIKSYPNRINLKKEYLVSLFQPIFGEQESTYFTQNFEDQGFFITSLYSGAKTNFILTLLLDIDEDPNEFETILNLIALELIYSDNLSNLANLNENYIQSLFNKIKAFPKLKEEVKYALLLESEIFKITLELFRKNASLTKEQFEKEFYRELGKITDISNIIHINLIINILKNLQILREETLEGMKIPTYFMIKDIFISRLPPLKIFENGNYRGAPEEFYQIIKQKIKDFFEDYTISEEDNLFIIKNIILNKNVYECFKVLRIAVVRKSDLEDLQYKGVNNVDECINTLSNANLITSWKDKYDREYFALVSDIRIDDFFPEYLFNSIMDQYTSKSQNEFILMRTAQILKEEIEKWRY
ncbi:MAG: hypothetical protein ACTSRZ_11570 [Promethearchaeota archaeon]